MLGKSSALIRTWRKTLSCLGNREDKKPALISHLLASHFGAYFRAEITLLFTLWTPRIRNWKKVATFSASDICGVTRTGFKSRHLYLKPDNIPKLTDSFEPQLKPFPNEFISAVFGVRTASPANKATDSCTRQRVVQAAHKSMRICFASLIDKLPAIDLMVHDEWDRVNCMHSNRSSTANKSIARFYRNASRLKTVRELQ